MSEYNREQLKQLLIMISLMLPGTALFIGGLKGMDGPLRGIPGLAMVAVGLLLAAAGGYYHYRKDYRPAGRGSLAAFLVISFFSAGAGVLVARLVAG